MRIRDDDAEQEVLLEQYRQCLENMRFERDAFWKRFNVFLLIDSGVLSFFGFFLTQSTQVLGNTSSQWLLISICVSSYLFNAVWIFMNGRSHNYFLYWLLQVKLLEENDFFLEVCTGLSQHFRSEVQYPHSRMSITTGGQIVPLCFCGIFMFIPVLFTNLWPIALSFDLLFTSILIVLGITMWGSGYKDTRQHMVTQR